MEPSFYVASEKGEQWLRLLPLFSFIHILLMKKLVLLLLLVLLLGLSFLSAQSNLVLNPSFEDGTASWEGGEETVLQYDPVGKLNEGAARLLVQSAASSLAGRQLFSDEWAILAGGNGLPYACSVYARADGDYAFQLQLSIRSADGSVRNVDSEVFQLTATYQRFGFSADFLPTDVGVRIRVFCGMSGGVYDFDNFRLLRQDIDRSSIAQFDHWEPKAFSIPTALTTVSLPEGTPTATIEVFTEDTIAPVLPTQVGVNSNFRSSPTLLDRTDLYQNFGAFRYPAGSGSNKYWWDCEPPATFAIEDVNPICGTSGNALSPEQFISFKENTRGEPTVVVNYFYARYGLTENNTRAERVQQAADYAAAFVHHLNVAHQAGIKYWEIGNECYGPWETGYDVNGSIVTGQEYGEDFRVFAEAMKAVDPNIWVGAVLGHNHQEWNEGVLPEVQHHADFLIVHQYYRVANAGQAAEALAEVASNMQEIQLTAALCTDKPTGHFPVAFTEYNTRGEYTVTIINGLFLAEALAEIAQNRYTLATAWVNEWNIDEEIHSKGLLAQNDPDQNDYTPRPTYMPYHYFRGFVGDQIVRVQGDESLPDVRVYASTFSTGEVGLMVVNYGEAEEQLQVSAAGNFESAYWYSVYANNAQPGNKKFYINGQTSSTIGGGPENFLDLPAQAASYDGNKMLPIAPYSLTFIVLSNDELVGLRDALDNSSGLRIFPNPASNWVQLQLPPGWDTEVTIYSSSGQKMELPITSTVQEEAMIMELDTSALTAGVYFIQLAGQTAKFVIQS